MIRAAVVFLIGGLLAAALLYDQVDAPTAEVAASEAATIITPTVSDPARLDGAWFCPAGSTIEGGFADHEVRVSNLSDEAAVANVSILTGEGKGPTLRVELAPLSTQQLELSTIAEAESAGAVVEIIGGTGVVGHRVQTANGPAEGPCATHVSSEWYFAAGRTERDSKQYLALLNPFPEDVVYNIELFRSVGRPRRPGRLQGGNVAGSSVQIIELGEHVPLEEVVAASITTVRGRLVVERLQVIDGELGPQGAALQLGVPGPAESWMLPAGRIQGSGDDQVIVFNPSPEDTAMIDLELWPVNPTDRSLYGLGPIPRELLPGRFEVIDLRIEADRFGLRLPFEVGVSVRSTNEVPVVAERWHFANAIDRSLIGAGGTGVAPSDDGAEADADADAADDPNADPNAEDPNAEPTDEQGAGDLDVPGILGGEAAELAQPTATVGIATSRGTEILSNRWLIPWLSTPTPDAAVVIVTSPEAVTVEAFMLVNGELAGPWRAGLVEGGRAIIPIESRGVGGPVLVVADGSISVEGQVVIEGVGLSIVPGIPTVDE